MALNGTGCSDCQSAGQLKTDQAGCVNYPVTPQASLVVKDEACWPNTAEGSLSHCQFSSIHLMSTDSEHMIPSLRPHHSHRQHFAAQTLTLTMDKSLTFVALSFTFCATSVVPLCPLFSQKRGLTHPAQFSPHHLHLFSTFGYGRTQQCSHKTEVLSLHSTLASFLYHHGPDSYCGNLLLPYEHGSV